MATNENNASPEASNTPKQTPNAGASDGTPMADTAAADKQGNTTPAAVVAATDIPDGKPHKPSSSNERSSGGRSSGGDRNDRNDRNSRGGKGGKGGGRRGRRDKPKKEYDEVLLEVRRVTRVTTGGRQLSFRAIILIGNRKGKVGLGVAKGGDVSIAVKKATREANKNIIEVPITDSLSIPYETVTKFKAARVKLIPAADGTGLKAGSSVRSVLELAGYTNILSKIMGTNNKLNNAIATLHALKGYKSDRLEKIHGKKKKEVVNKDDSKKVVAKKDETKKAAAAPSQVNSDKKKD